MSRTLRLLYWLYESRLRRQIGSHAVPRHVGIILDGNRRYARKHGLADPRAAYDLGADKLDDVLAWCSDLAIPAVTLWVCSIDNLKRPRTEVAGILAAVEAKISALTNDPAIHRRHVRVKAVGRLDLLPPSTVMVLREAEKATADYDSLTRRQDFFGPGMPGPFEWSLSRSGLSAAIRSSLPRSWLPGRPPKTMLARA